MSDNIYAILLAAWVVVSCVYITLHLRDWMRKA